MYLLIINIHVSDPASIMLIEDKNMSHMEYVFHVSVSL